MSAAKTIHFEPTVGIVEEAISYLQNPLCQEKYWAEID
jgi:hypothetical protein